MSSNTESRKYIADQDPSHPMHALLADAPPFIDIRRENEVAGTVVDVDGRGDYMVDITDWQKASVPFPSRGPLLTPNVGDPIDMKVQQRKHSDSNDMPNFQPIFHRRRNRSSETPGEELVGTDLTVEITWKSRKGSRGVRYGDVEGFLPVSWIGRATQQALAIRDESDNPEDHPINPISVKVVGINEEMGNIVVSEVAFLFEQDMSVLLNNNDNPVDFTVTEVNRHGLVGYFVGPSGERHQGFIPRQLVSHDQTGHIEEQFRPGERLTAVVTVAKPVPDKPGLYDVKLSAKACEPDPWRTVEADFPIGATVPGEVVKDLEHVYLISVAPGVTGAVGKNYAGKRLQVGEAVETRIRWTNPEKRRMGLEIK